MISFFRNIRQRLLRENRVTRYLAYAVGEIILVMVGILLALQVNNWNDFRKNQEDKKNLLIAIRQEFQSNLKRIQTHKKELTLRNGYTLRVLNFSAGQQSDIPLDSIRYYASMMLFPQTALLTKSTVEEAVSSGKFGMLDSDLSIQLSMYMDYLEGYRTLSDNISLLQSPEINQIMLNLGGYARIYKDYFPDKMVAAHPGFRLNDAEFKLKIRSTDTYGVLAKFYLENTSQELWIQVLEETIEKSLREIEKNLND